MKRLHHIDGIRGWAAMAVLFSHLCHEVFGKLFPQYNNLVLRVILDGNLAVCIFFVLSGDALSTAFLSSGRYSILAKMTVKRYFRLAGPILLSCILVYALMCCGLIYSHEAAFLVNNEPWLGAFLNFQPSLLDAIKFGLRFAFTDPFSAPSYNNFLWPMGIELVGSFGLFLYLALYKNLKYPLASVGFFAIIFTISRSYFGLFCIGIIFSHLRINGFFERVIHSESGKNLMLFGNILWLCLAFLAASLDEKVFQINIVLAGLFIFLAYCQIWTIQFFSNSLSRFLGRISFPLYITHFAVIVSYTSFMIVWVSSKNTLNFTNSFMVAMSSALIAILLADVFSRVELMYLSYLEKAALHLIKEG